MDDQQRCDGAHDASPQRHFEYKDLGSKIEVANADGRKIRGVGTVSVRFTGIYGRRIKMVDVQYIPVLDHQLLSISRLGERGMSVEFQKKSCTIWNKFKAIASEKKMGKAYVLDFEKDMVHYVQNASVTN